MSTNENETAVLKWRAEREERLRTSEKSWFGLAGLFWLKDGANTFGSDPSCDFILPAQAPARVGAFYFLNGEVTVKAEPKVKLTHNGGKPPTQPLRDDQQDDPDYLYLSRWIFVVIKRGTSTLIRMWDIEHPARKALTTLNYYPYNPQYRFVAEYSGYAPYKLIKQEDIIGEVHDSKMIGFATFEWEGKKYRLDAEDGGDGLFIAFRDRTTAKTTYAGGRYMSTEKPQNGQVVIDFNKAYNMPCAYALYATCTLPARENHLPIPIEAGEKKYREDH
jgi:uncharacterized protein (DUF1684 family)